MDLWPCRPEEGDFNAGFVAPTAVAIRDANQLRLYRWGRLVLMLHSCFILCALLWRGVQHGGSDGIANVDLWDKGHADGRIDACWMV